MKLRTLHVVSKGVLNFKQSASRIQDLNLNQNLEIELYSLHPKAVNHVQILQPIKEQKLLNHSITTLLDVDPVSIACKI